MPTRYQENSRIRPGAPDRLRDQQLAVTPSRTTASVRNSSIWTCRAFPCCARFRRGIGERPPLPRDRNASVSVTPSRIKCRRFSSSPFAMFGVEFPLRRGLIVQPVGDGLALFKHGQDIRFTDAITLTDQCILQHFMCGTRDLARNSTRPRLGRDSPTGPVRGCFPIDAP